MLSEMMDIKCQRGESGLLRRTNKLRLFGLRLTSHHTTGRGKKRRKGGGGGEPKKKKKAKEMLWEGGKKPGPRRGGMAGKGVRLRCDEGATQ